MLFYLILCVLYFKLTFEHFLLSEALRDHISNVSVEYSLLVSVAIGILTCSFKNSRIHILTLSIHAYLCSCTPAYLLISLYTWLSLCLYPFFVISLSLSHSTHTHSLSLSLSLSRSVSFSLYYKLHDQFWEVSI